ncbi:glycosyltransferase family 39 protein, partial [bacterium]|nr:glycosyltransferase family 39 protein [bacterium]
MVASSISIFGEFTPFTVRFPIALMSLILVFATYFLGKRVVSEKFGFYSACVLLSSFFFLMLSHIAILDSLLM